MIEIIGFKILTKIQDIRSASNIERNTIPDSGRYVAKSLAGKTFSKGAEKLEGILRAGASQGRLESKIMAYGWGLVKMFCLMCDRGNFEIYTGINREPLDVNEEAC